VPGLIVFSRGASFDIVITMTSAWALGLFVSAELSIDRRKQIGFLAGFYCFVGLSVLAKGLVGLVIPFGVVGLYYLLRRAWPNRTIWLSLVWGLPLAILVASIWYGPVVYKHGWFFIDEFFIQHHFARYVSNKYHHPQPLYFYPAILLMLLVPWSPILIDALVGAKSWSWKDGDSLDRVLVFALACVAMPIVFFSFSGSKLPGYILPVIPGASILVGYRLVQAKWSLKLSAALCVLMGVVGLLYLARGEKLPMAWSVAAATPFVPWWRAGVVFEALISSLDHRNERLCDDRSCVDLCSSQYCSTRIDSAAVNAG
jgi:4-amino-4-deoxy-L-arabinose transferase-like glycosyltransferase